jgi:hypothetical protein
MKYTAPAITNTRKASAVLGSNANASVFSSMKGNGAPDNAATQTDSSAYTANC